MYILLSLIEIQDTLSLVNKEEGIKAFTNFLDKHFGGWKSFLQSLTHVNFPSRGKGSIAERAWQGYVSGHMFLHALNNNVSLNESAKALSNELYTLLPPVPEDLAKPTPENLIKNYWPRFQTVAHFWAAMQFFSLPETTDIVVRLDKAIPSPKLRGDFKPGWRGIADLAHSLLENSVDAKRYKTAKPLLNPETAFKIIFV